MNPGTADQKSEARNPKEIRSPKAEDPSSPAVRDFGIRNSGFFRASGFGIRNSGSGRPLAPQWASSTIGRRSDAVGATRVGATVLPLPEGEGRGEGEQVARAVRVSKT